MESVDVAWDRIPLTSSVTLAKLQKAFFLSGMIVTPAHLGLLGGLNELTCAKHSSQGPAHPQVSTNDSLPGT